jgi:hypothetical protein
LWIDGSFQTGPFNIRRSILIRSFFIWVGSSIDRCHVQLSAQSNPSRPDVDAA